MAKAVGALLLKTIGASHRALNRAGALPELEVLESGPMGHRAQMLVQGSPQLVHQFVTETRSTDLDRSLILHPISDVVMQAYLGLVTEPLQEVVMVIETDFVGELLSFAEAAHQNGWAILDLRQLRSGSSPGHLILSGSTKALNSEWLKDLKRLHDNITILENLSPGYRDFWSLKPSST